ncbi:MAG: hypothetical protein KKG75_01875 [Nanoarchaeota archaeon]|nr:hypothetical protein [Nanoarchaeota archaeon]
MYIRIKTHKNQRYAYLVQTKRYKRSPYPKQKTIAYLGRVITPKKTQNIHFKEHINNNLKDYLKDKKTKDIFLDLINLELKNHTLKINLEDISEDSKPIVYEINEGFLCNYTIKKLLNFKLPIQTPEKDAPIDLAKTILEAGIKISPNLFIQIFKKLKY